MMTRDYSTPALRHACPQIERAQYDRADARTATRRHFANTIVAQVANEHGAVCIDSHASGIVEGGVAPGTVGI